MFLSENNGKSGPGGPAFPSFPLAKTGERHYNREEGGGPCILQTTTRTPAVHRTAPPGWRTWSGGTQGRASGSLCTTDHCDLQDENGAPLGGWDWTPILDQYWRARDKGGSEVKVLLGLELGGAYTDPGRAEALVAAAPLDFVIGSIHNLSPEAGGRDFFYLGLPLRGGVLHHSWMTISPVCWL